MNNKQDEKDRRILQAKGKHPAPCARHCEAMAFEIEIRSLRAQVDRLTEERDALRAELEALKRQKPVAVVVQRAAYEDGTFNPCNELNWAGRNCENDFPPGTPLYATPPDAAKRVAELESSYQASIKSLRKDLESQAKIIGEITRKAQEKIAELEEELAGVRKDAARKDAERINGLRELCGYAEDGSETVVRVFQDDATRDWIVKVGNGPSNSSGYGRSLREALDAAIAKATGGA